MKAALDLGMDFAPKERWTGSRALVRIVEGSCPACGGVTRYETVEQPALLRHGGHGATERTVVASCSCGWRCQVERSEVLP